MEDLKKFYDILKKERFYIFGAIIFGLIFAFIFFIYSTKCYSEEIQGGISEKVVRFHVLANSDLDFDQSLKLKVRDGVLQKYGENLSSFESKEETICFLDSTKMEIKKYAEDIIKKEGYNYSVEVSLVREEFPQKSYGELVFPKGVYDSLRIEIGEAKGKNWWCVLYPNMCYVDASVGFTTNESNTRLKNTLTKEEFLIISSTKDKKIVPKIKFKIVEFWQ